MNVTEPASLERASRPSAPLPVNRSRQRAPVITGDIQLKSVSRTLSVVGLRPSTAENVRRRLLHCPPIILRVLVISPLLRLLVLLRLGLLGFRLAI